MNRLITQLSVFGLISLLAAPVWAQGGTQVTVSKRDCQRLIKHAPSADVAYKAGVDVRGKKVKGADLNPSTIQVPKEITIPLGMEFAGKYGIGAGYDATATVGTIKYDLASGGLTYNGKPLTDSDTRAIERACAQQYGGR